MVNLENKETLLLGAVYRSPNSTDINTRNLFTLLDAFSEVHCNYKLIVRDFNFPNINWTDWTTPHGVIHREFLFLECLRDNFLYQLVDDPTRYRHGQALNVLNLVIVDNPEFIKKVNLCSNLGASDHVALEIILDSTITKTEETVQKKKLL